MPRPISGRKGRAALIVADTTWRGQGGRIGFADVPPTREAHRRGGSGAVFDRHSVACSEPSPWASDSRREDR